MKTVIELLSTDTRLYVALYYMYIVSIVI